jgi:hypothetical protein
VASRAEFAEIMAYLGAAVGKEPTAEQCEVYFDLLGHLDADVLRQAVRRAVHEHKISTIPPVGMIAAHARDLTQPPTPIAAAWGQVRVTALRWSNWLLDGSPTDEKTLARMHADMASLPPAALAAAVAYGWENILRAEPGVAFAQFQRNYESLAGRERTEAALPPAARLPKQVAGIIGAIGRLEGVKP